MNGTLCDACMEGYKPGTLQKCDNCLGEFCTNCMSDHGCKEDDI